MSSLTMIHNPSSHYIFLPGDCSHSICLNYKRCCMCACVCAYTYIYICTCIYSYLCMYVCLYVCIYLSIYISTLPSINTYNNKELISSCICFLQQRQQDHPVGRDWIWSSCRSSKKWLWLVAQWASE